MDYKVKVNNTIYVVKADSAEEAKKIAIERDQERMRSVYKMVKVNGAYTVRRA